MSEYETIYNLLVKTNAGLGVFMILVAGIHFCWLMIFYTTIKKYVCYELDNCKYFGEYGKVEPKD